MSRLEKKCYVGSAAFHGLLLLILLLTAAFRSRQNAELPGPIMTITGPPPSAGGGARAEAQPAPQPQPQPPVHQPDPPVRQPDPPKPPEPKPKEIKPAVAKDHEKDDGPLPIKPKTTKKEKETPKEKSLTASNKPSLTNTVKRPTVDNTKAAQQVAQLQREKQDRINRENKAAQQAAQAVRDREISDVLTGVGNGLSKFPIVSASTGGDTSGGVATGQYGEGLKDYYDAKWVLNADAYDGEASTSVKVIVRRDGSIVSATITKGSGNTAFDRSVKAALNAVTRVRPFPPEMKDGEKEFTWRFERRTKF